MSSADALGWLADLVAQHYYVEGVPGIQRRRWNFVGSQWVITDSSVSEWATIALSPDFAGQEGTFDSLHLRGVTPPPDNPSEGLTINAGADKIRLATANYQFAIAYASGTSTFDFTDSIVDIVCDSFTVNGASIGGLSGAMAPTPSTLLQRTADGTGRVASLSLESDSDAIRTIEAYAADGTTYAGLTIDALEQAFALSGSAVITLAVQDGTPVIRMLEAATPISELATSGTLSLSRVNVLTTSLSASQTVPDASTNYDRTILVYNLSGETAYLNASGSDTFEGGAVTSMDADQIEIADGGWLRLRAGSGSWYAVESGSSGGGGGGTPYASPPEDVGQPGYAAAGASADYARGDHVHALPYATSSDGDASSLVVTTAQGAVKVRGVVAINFTGPKYIAVAPSGWNDGSTTYAANTLLSSEALWISPGVLTAVGKLVVSDASGAGVSLSAVDSANSAGTFTAIATTHTISATSAVVSAPTQTRTDDHAGYATTEEYRAAKTIVHGADVTSLSDTMAQAASGAGGARTIRGQKGAAGSVGGNLVLGAGDGGTAGTNAPGNVIAKVGTSVAGASGKFRVAREDGTSFFNVYENVAGNTLITGVSDASTIVLGGTAGASGNGIAIVPSSYVTITATSGYLLLNSHLCYQAAEVTRAGPSYQGRWTDRRDLTIATATSGNLATIAIPAGVTCRLHECTALSANSDDSIAGEWVMTTAGLYRNNGGTITTLRAAVFTATGDATELSQVTIAVSFSGATLQLTYALGNAKARKISSEMIARMTA